MIGIIWHASRGYRVTPWRSPYLRWRMETYWGISAEQIGFRQFFALLWKQRRDIVRYCRWAERMRARFVN